MSINNLWQICHTNRMGNKLLTEYLVGMIRDQEMTSKQVSQELVISTERVRNWYYRNTGMTALDLLLLMSEYDIILEFVNSMRNTYASYKKEKMQSY
jgi:hypothetical protein